MFWSVGKEIGSFELCVTKSSNLVFPWKTRCFKLHSTENIFSLVGNKIGFFECYIAKKQRFSFLFAKTRCTHTKNMFWSVFRKVVLFPVLLHGKKVFFQFADLILLKTTSFLLYGQVTMVLLVFGGVTLFSALSF